MIPSKAKSLKIRRFRTKYKKFRIRAHQFWLKTKTFTIEKVLRAKSFVKKRVQVRSGKPKAKVLEQAEKERPKPLRGIKLKYELLPIRKYR